jgi:hypothetical protein
MQQLASYFSTIGWVLRSGGADGADKAFEQGCTNVSGKKEIFLPWYGFNGNASQLYDIPEKAYDIAKQYHPNWNNLTNKVKRLMARNTQQILGADLTTPSTFVVCWTPDGCVSHNTRTCDTGGTGQAISIASTVNIPVINLYDYDDAVVQLQTLLNKFDNQGL